jgi:hypothetical protein
LSDEKDTELATNIRVISKFGNKIKEKLINSYNKSFGRVIFVEVLERA